MNKLFSKFYVTIAFLSVLNLVNFQVFSATPATKTVVLIKTTMGDIQVELFPEEAPETVKNFIALAEGKKEFTDAKTGKKTTKPFYDGLIFHRVINKFMIQGGDPLGTGSGDPGYKFKDEINGVYLGLDKLMVMKDGKFHAWLGRPGGRRFVISVLLPVYKKLGIKNKVDAKKKEKEFIAELNKMTLLDVYKNMGYQYNTTRNSHSPKRGSLAMANSGPNTNGSQFFINIIDTPWLTGKHTVFGQVIKGMDIVDKISKAPVGAGNKPVTVIKILSIRQMK